MSTAEATFCGLVGTIVHDVLAISVPASVMPQVSGRLPKNSDNMEFMIHLNVERETFVVRTIMPKMSSSLDISGAAIKAMQAMQKSVAAVFEDQCKGMKSGETEQYNGNEFIDPEHPTPLDPRD